MDDPRNAIARIADRPEKHDEEWYLVRNRADRRRRRGTKGRYGRRVAAAAADEAALERRRRGGPTASQRRKAKRAAQRNAADLLAVAAWLRQNPGPTSAEAFAAHEAELRAHLADAAERAGFAWDQVFEAITQVMNAYREPTGG